MNGSAEQSASLPPHFSESVCRASQSDALVVSDTSHSPLLLPFAYMSSDITTHKPCKLLRRQACAGSYLPLREKDITGEMLAAHP
ncbi:hypothetical protein ILYODFUR_025027 [Ilyodon furcidens]|uniref:Uncharacterized protein n=1 Tax=Ilyodon furcidens TaxID=33524 RepID=A0ABV0VGW6_9TELE